MQIENTGEEERGDGRGTGQLIRRKSSGRIRRLRVRSDGRRKTIVAHRQ